MRENRIHSLRVVLKGGKVNCAKQQERPGIDERKNRSFYRKIFGNKKNANIQRGTFTIREKYPTLNPVAYSTIVATPLIPAGANWFLAIKSSYVRANSVAKATINRQSSRTRRTELAFIFYLLIHYNTADGAMQERDTSFLPATKICRVSDKKRTPLAEQCPFLVETVGLDLRPLACEASALTN